MKPKLTPWFPGSVNPVREGVYEKKFGGHFGRDYQYWDGHRWFYGCSTPEATAEKWGSSFDHPAERPWRGLASKP